MFFLLEAKPDLNHHHGLKENDLKVFSKSYVYFFQKRRKGAGREGRRKEKKERKKERKKDEGKRKRERGRKERREEGRKKRKKSQLSEWRRVSVKCLSF
jgi:hypothetical protein